MEKMVHVQAIILLLEGLQYCKELRYEELYLIYQQEILYEALYLQDIRLFT